MKGLNFRMLWTVSSMAGALLGAGCAGPHGVFTLQPGPPGEQPAMQVWPAAPETPRYRYAGELLGEINFGEEQAQRSAGVRIVRWLVGVDDDRSRRRTLSRPQGGVVDRSGRILVADVGRGGIFVFDTVGGELTYWNQADRGAGFVSPLAVTVGPNDEIHVSDPELKRVVRLDRRGQPLGSYGEGLLLRPTGIVRDAAAGLIYVADTAAHDIKVFDERYRVVRILGGPGTEPGRFNAPTFLCLTAGNLVVSDTLNARVQILRSDGVPVREIGRRGIYVGNLVRPKGVAADDEGNVYVVEGYYDHLLVFSPQGELLLPIGGTGTGSGRFFLPGGVWSDPQNRIFVSDVFNGRVAVFQFLGP